VIDIDWTVIIVGLGTALINSFFAWCSRRSANRASKHATEAKDVADSLRPPPEE
jgi:hypothetical protein